MKLEKDLILFLTKEIYERMKNCVRNSSPNEAFGLILGPAPKEIALSSPGEFQYHYIGEIFECIKSSEASPVSFLIDNTPELFKIIESAMKKYNQRLLSIFHSHPSGTHPSGFDLHYMKFLVESYKKLYNSKYKVRVGIKNQIWTIMDGNNFKMNGFIYLEEEIQQIQLIIKD